MEISQSKTQIKAKKAEHEPDSKRNISFSDCLSSKRSQIMLFENIKSHMSNTKPEIF